MEKVKAIFLFNQKNNDLFVVFPDSPEGLDLFTSYSHIGQHSACHKGYIDESENAMESEYAELKKELEYIGYELDIVTKESYFEDLEGIF